MPVVSKVCNGTPPLGAVFKQCSMASAHVGQPGGPTKPLLPKAQHQDDVAAEVEMMYKHV